MREFREAVRRRLAGVALGPRREAEIVEEIALHMDDRCAEYRSVMAAITLVASVLPARRAAGLDPVEALREE
jgi:ABC-type lipoprotein release transport system permease subunit